MPHPTTPATLTLRPATPADLPQVADLDHEAFVPYGTAESPAIIAARQSIFPAGFIVLTDAAGAVLAYGSAETWRELREPGLDEDPRLTHQPDSPIFCITAMAVRRAHWRQGLATRILDRLLDIARAHNCAQVVLETTHAQGFYERRGFYVVQQRQERGVTLTVMTLDL